MEDSQIVKSEAFRALNLMVDRAARDAVGWTGMLIDLAKRAPEYQDDIATRTYEEGSAAVSLPITQADIRRIRDMANDALAAIEVVNSVQVMKLRLLNDYDFTKGDDSDRAAVFGMAA